MSIVGANLDMLLGLGSHAAGLTFVQISLRGVVVFVAARIRASRRLSQVWCQGSHHQ